jgi:hypothetical protein
MSRFEFPPVEKTSVHEEIPTGGNEEVSTGGKGSRFSPVEENLPIA